MSAPHTLLYLSEAEVQQTITMAEAVDLAEKGIRADAAGQVVGNKFYTSIGDAGFIKPFSGYIAGEEYFYVKTFTFFSANPEKFDLPTVASQVLLFDARNGMPVCLMEASWVTGLKTGASTAVTAGILSRRGAKNAAIFGAGLQGQMHLRGLAQRIQLEKAWLLDILPDVAQMAAADLTEELGFPVEAEVLSNREAVVRQSDLIIMVTTGDQALVRFDWLRPGAFVAKLGSYTEIESDVILKAEKVVVDNWQYVSPRIPELKQLVAENRFSFEDVHSEWPHIVAGRQHGRETEKEIIVYIALGIWGEYAAILPEVYRRAQQKNLGQKISLSI